MFDWFRKKVERRFRTLLTVLSGVLVPLDRQRFQRYRLVHTGWMWGIVPRLELESMGVVDLSTALDGSIRHTEKVLMNFAGTLQDEVRTGIQRSASNRAVRDRNRFTQKVDELVKGGDQLPSVIVKNGRASIQAVQRTLVETIGKIAKDRFEASVKKTLAQILGYAREEVGTNGKGPQQMAFPNGIKFFHSVKRKTIVVVEEAPRVRTILWDNKQISLSFPYVIFVVHFKDGAYEYAQLFFRNAPLKHVNDDLMTPILPDILPGRVLPSGAYEEQTLNWICFPGPKVFQGNPMEMTVSCQQVFWNSVFQSTHWQRHCTFEFNSMNFSLQGWINSSAHDPGFILGIPWPKSGLTLARLFAYHKEDDQMAPARDQLNKLERYLLEVSDRVSTGIQEAVVETLAENEDMILARRTFDKQLQAALDEVNLKEELKRVIESELVASCTDEQTTAILHAVSERLTARVAELIRPAASSLSENVTETLLGFSKRSER